MSNFTLTTYPENSGTFPIWVELPPKLKKCVLGPELVRKYAFLNEIKLTPVELQELKDVIKDYGYPMQRWVQLTTKPTRVRRKWLQAILFEAGASHDTCWYQNEAATRNSDLDCGYQLHRVWHKLYSGGGDAE